jgi:transcriptional regulator with XRE-family HTH domain
LTDKVRFGQWLQGEREARGWSQADLARRCGRGRSVLHKIENGTALPALETFIALALALNLSPNVLFRNMGLLSELPERDVDLEHWKHLLAQMDPADEEELRRIAEIKLERYQKMNR